MTSLTDVIFILGAVLVGIGAMNMLILTRPDASKKERFFIGNAVSVGIGTSTMLIITHFKG